MMEQEHKVKIIHQDGEIDNDVSEEEQDYPSKKSLSGCVSWGIAIIMTLIAMAIIIPLIPSSWFKSDMWIVFGFIMPIFIGAVSTLFLHQELNLESLSETLLLILKQMFVITILLFGLALLGVGALLGFCVMMMLN